MGRRQRSAIPLVPTEKAKKSPLRALRAVRWRYGPGDFGYKITMMDPRLPLSAILLACLASSLDGQRDILSPHRNPRATVRMPEPMVEVFRQLQIMQNTAENIGPVSYDDQGREVCDNPRWKAAYEALRRHYVDPGFLAYILRESGSVQHRDVALYGSYFVDNPDYVLDLIEHIPGEPVREFREKSYVRAINYLKVHLPQRYGDLTEDQIAALNRPPVGSPVANALGITADPRPEEPLHSLDLRPYFQLLELDSEADQAQGLWFMKECFWIRDELSVIWMERMVPRLRMFLRSEDVRVRKEAFGVIEAADPSHRPVPSMDSDPKDVEEWLDAVLYELYPPIRVISSGLIDLYPSEDLDEVVKVGSELLARDGIGSARNIQVNGVHYRGFRIARAPEPLDKLDIPIGAVIVSVNGHPVSESARLLEIVKTELEHKAQLLVEYVHNGNLLAIEYRVRK